MEPPPDQVGDNADWRTWVEVPAPIVSANLIPNEPELFLRIAFYQSTIEGCARPGNQGLEVIGDDIVARLTLMQPPSTPWAIPCHEEVVELDAVEPILQPLEPGRTYRVIVNDQAVTTFTLPDPGMPHTLIDESPIERAEVAVLESAPPQYELAVVSAMPRGSTCSRFNGYEIRRSEPGRIDVTITHHEVADQNVPCTADYPIVETNVPLGSDFEPGVEYMVRINEEATASFVAQ